jgi:membrane protease YdiL (CAAX protease family)
MEAQESKRSGPLREAVRSHPFATFVGVTLVLTWAFWMLPVLEQAGYLETAPPWWGLGSFGPSVSGMILAFVVGGRRRLTELLRATVRWRVHPAWYAAAALVPLIVAAPALLVHWAAGDPVAWSELPSPALLPVLFLQIFFLGGPLNEELGWRGFALPELQRTHSALASSLILGAVWAGWHLPLFWAGAAGYTALPFHWYVVNVLALSVVFTWSFNGTGGSVLLAILLHATFNTTNWILLPLLGNQEARGAAVYVLTLTIVAALLVWRRGGTYLCAQEQLVTAEGSAAEESPAGESAAGGSQGR